MGCRRLEGTQQFEEYLALSRFITFKEGHSLRVRVGHVVENGFLFYDWLAGGRLNTKKETIDLIWRERCEVHRNYRKWSSLKRNC